MRLAMSRKCIAAAVATAALLSGCDQSRSPHAPAQMSRAQVVPAARALYQALLATSTRSVDLLDWGYTPCGTGEAKLSYRISMRLFAFAAGQNTDFEAYRRRVASIVRAAGWSLRRRPATRSVTLPTVPSADYRLSRRHGMVGLTGRLALVGDVNPLVGVSGMVSMSGPCFDAGGAAGSLEANSAGPPFPTRDPAPSPSHS